jgi:hypothetical protein
MAGARVALAADDAAEVFDADAVRMVVIIRHRCAWLLKSSFNSRIKIMIGHAHGMRNGRGLKDPEVRTRRITGGGEVSLKYL